jgi:hypothetical protein
MVFNLRFITVFSFAVILCNMVNLVNAQSITRSTISAFGGSNQLGETTFQYTVGQSSNTSVSIDQGVGIRQGFIQPCLSKNLRNELEQINVLIYPNPCKDFIYLEGDLASIDEIKLMDMHGRTILTQQKFDIQSEYMLNVSNVSSGLYIIHLLNEKGIEKSFKIIIASSI